MIDGDTIELGDGRLVRYIGVDAPEARRKVGERWIVDPEPFSRAATEANRQLVEGKAVRLEYDVQTHDRYGRWLAYVYVGERMVNEELLASGYAQECARRSLPSYSGPLFDAMAQIDEGES